MEIRTADVFTPGKYPKYTYNPRTAYQLETKLQDALEDGGTIVSLSGPTKSGKTVLAKKVLKEFSPEGNYVWLSGGEIESLDDFWRKVAEKLSINLPKTLSENGGRDRGGNFSISGPGISLGVNRLKNEGYLQQSDVLVSLRQLVLEHLLDSEIALVVDDFHFIKSNVQKEIVRSLKDPLFEGLSALFISITHRWNDSSRMVEDMRARVTSINIPSWTTEELEQICTSGFEKLRIKFPRKVQEEIAGNSYGSPFIVQKICRSLVRDLNNFRKGGDVVKELTNLPNEKFYRDNISHEYENSFDILKRGPQRKGTPRNIRKLKGGIQTDIYGLVLYVIRETGPRLQITLDEIMNLVAKNAIDKPQRHEISKVLGRMKKIAADKKIQSGGRFSEDEDLEDDSLYGGMEPMIDFVDEGTPSAKLVITDPFFAYYLRWAKLSFNATEISE